MCSWIPFGEDWGLDFFYCTSTHQWRYQQGSAFETSATQSSFIPSANIGRVPIVLRHYSDARDTGANKAKSFSWRDFVLER